MNNEKKFKQDSTTKAISEKTIIFAKKKYPQKITKLWECSFKNPMSGNAHNFRQRNKVTLRILQAIAHKNNAQLQELYNDKWFG
jgi:hypothetical protein